MNNYKIINTHTNEIIKALNDLGYVWTPKKFDEQDCLLKAHWILAEHSGAITYSSGTMIDYPIDFKELTLPQLRDLVAKSKNEQGLISGADALRALADGQLVQWMTGDAFQDVTDEWQIREFSHPSFKFRLKPRTIKLSLEIPVCGSNPKQGQTLWILNSQHPNEYDSIVLEAAFDEPAYWWSSEEEIKQVVAALSGIKG